MAALPDAPVAGTRPLLRPMAVKSARRENVEAIVVALLIALFIRTFVVEAFKIPSGSMLPTLQIGDHLLVNKFLYGPRLEIPFTTISFGRLPGLRTPQRGDVIVFAYPRDPSQNYIKRVVAVGGQTVQLIGTRLFVDGVQVEDPYATYRYGGRSQVSSYGVLAPVRVPEGHLFVMGDNRDASSDSRVWGFVPLANVKGLAIIIYWSFAQERGRFVRWERIGRLVP
jgi:signal peptidase I